tara:strand:- start:721 stop:1098 length:378 start_codon:yes stop_codon:yes gene_type:complete
MTLSLRMGLSLFLALAMVVADSDLVVAQGSPGSGPGVNQPPGGGSGIQMPPGGMNAGASNKDQFEQGDVKIAGNDDGGVAADAALQSMLPYIIGVVVVIIVIVVYFVKKAGSGDGAEAGSGNEAG